MPQLVNLGNFVTIAGRKVANGMASGVDTKAIVESKVEAYSAPLVKKQAEVKVNEEKIKALSQMKSQLNALKTAADALRNPPGFNATSVFNLRSGVMTTNETSSAIPYIEPSFDPGAPIAKHKIYVEQLADIKRDTIGTALNSGFASNITSVTNIDGTNNNFKAGVFQINNIDITLEVGDTLRDIAAKFNYLQKNTNTRADIIKISDTDFRLVLSSTKTGVSNAFAITDNNNVLATLNRVEVPAKNAKFKFNDLAIERPSNIVGDVIDKVKFVLKNVNTASDKYVELNISNDSDAILNAIVEFVNKYNEFMEFVTEQKERIDLSHYAETAILANESVLDESVNNIQSVLVSIIGGLEYKAPNSLGALGINMKTVRNDGKTEELYATYNSLEVDAVKLSTKLTTELDNVNKLFACNFNALETKLKVAERKGIIKLNNFQLKIKTSGLDAPLSSTEKVAVSYDDNGTPKTIYADFIQSKVDNSGVIRGRNNTVIAGLEIYYLGNANGSLDQIDVNITQGVADRLHAIINQFTSLDGRIETEQKRLGISNTGLKNSIAQLEKNVAKFTQEQLAIGARTEQQILAGNAMITFIDTFNSHKSNK